MEFDMELKDYIAESFNKAYGYKIKIDYKIINYYFNYIMEINQKLNIPESTKILQNESINWESVSQISELLKPGHEIGQSEILFAQIEDAEIQKQIDKLEATKTANKMENRTVEPQKSTATFEDFAKLDLRVGTIIEAEKMPKANKLLVLKVDTGINVRTIVSGIAEHFSLEEVIGKRVTILANLAPRALRGVESEGMILMTNNAEGKLVFVNPDADGVDNGAMIS
jgi:methionyl-tRNA synthetase